MIIKKGQTGSFCSLGEHNNEIRLNNYNRKVKGDDSMMSNKNFRDMMIKSFECDLDFERVKTTSIDGKCIGYQIYCISELGIYKLTYKINSISLEVYAEDEEDYFIIGRKEVTFEKILEHFLFDDITFTDICKHYGFMAIEDYVRQCEEL